MKSLLAIFISSALVVSGYSQTRNVLVNTNNAVVQPTNFWSADASNARTGLGLGTAATNPASAFQPSSGVLSNLASSNAVDLTNLRASNVVGVLSLERGGTGATNDVSARTALGLGTASTNPASAFQPSSTTLSNLASSNAVNLTNLRATNIVGIIPASNISSLSLTNISGNLAISNGGTGAADAPTARTNLGLGSTNDITNRTLVLPQADGLSSSTAYGIQWRNIYPASNGLIALSGTDDQGQTTFRISTGTISGTTAEVALFNASKITFYKPLDFNNTTNAATTRTNLGLGWAALTNTSASGFGASLYGSNTNPVLVNTNGEVVSPTNFWQAAPINTVLQNITNVVGNATNAATNARMLFLYSLAPTVTNVTSTITLPTNGSTFGGDVATITHLGPTSSVTAIRALGAGTNIITLNQPEESVRLIYRDSGWTLMDNISYIEPIFFSGTNAAANAAASRTNLGLGVGSTNTIGAGKLILGNGSTFIIEEPANGTAIITFQDDIDPVILNSTHWNDTNVRTSLGLGATNNVTFSNITASGTLTATSTVTARTNLVVEGFVDFSTNRTNNSPASGANFGDRSLWLQIKIGTNNFYVPLYQ
jgi:hypothetical protein